MRERGLKCSLPEAHTGNFPVAPRAGAWIEMMPVACLAIADRVAPRAGAWIEIRKLYPYAHRFPVAPRAGAWIEIVLDLFVNALTQVAPRAGAWIEIYSPAGSYIAPGCRSPCGSVD